LLFLMMVMGCKRFALAEKPLQTLFRSFRADSF